MKYTPPFGSIDPNASYVNGDPATGTQGSIPPAAAQEQPQREILAVITAAGLTPSQSDLTQLQQAIRRQIALGSYAVAGGTANALTATLTPAPAALTAGLTVWLDIAAANTGAATLNLNGLGAVPILRQSGDALAAGDLAPPAIVPMTYDGAAWYAIGAGAGNATPSWWRLSAPTITIPSGVPTQIGNYGASTSRGIDTIVNAGTGAVTIGARDAGLYVLSAGCNTTLMSNAESIALYANGVRMAVAWGASPSVQSYLLDQAVTTIMRLAAGDVVTATYLQTNSDGTTRALEAGAWNHFAGARIGA